MPPLRLHPVPLRSAIVEPETAPDTRIASLHRAVAPNDTAGTRRLSPEWRHALVVGAGSFAIARVVTELIALVTAYGSSFGSVVRHNPQAAITVWEQWDARYYLNIATTGYSTPQFAAFPPLPSLLIRAVSSFLHMEPLVAGLLISFVAGCAACAVLIRLVGLDHDSRTAALSVFLLLTFPTALFLQTVYAESLLLLLCVAAFLAIRRGNVALAGVLAGLAVLTKTYAVILVIPLFWEHLEMRGWSPARGLRASALIVVPTVLALTGWMLFLARTFHDASLVLTAERFWGRTASPPWVAFAGGVRSITGAHLVEGMSLVAALLLIAAAVYAWRRVRRSYAILLALSALAFTTSGVLTSTARYSIVVFPLFIVAAVIAVRRTWLERIWVVTTIPLGVYLLSAFATGRWAG